MNHAEKLEGIAARMMNDILAGESVRFGNNKYDFWDMKDVQEYMVVELDEEYETLMLSFMLDAGNNDLNIPAQQKAAFDALTFKALEQFAETKAQRLFNYLVEEGE
jgi:hypothetical protein